METERLAYSPQEAAKALGISRAFLYRLIQSGELRSFRIGRRRMVSAEALKDLIARMEGADQGDSR